MTTPYLSQDIAAEEGCRLEAYRDTLGVWTIGYGHTGPAIVEGVTWTQQQADDQLAQDVLACVRELDHAETWWRQMNDPRQDVLAQMVFQLGLHGVQAFEHMLNAAQEGDYPAAAAAMLQSLWARQTPARAQRLAAQMLSGQRS